MKAHMLRLKAFAMIALISFSFVGCSDSDDDDEKSFLETHGGTVWKLGEPEDGFSVYAQINNTENNPFEIWVYDETRDCYEYQSITDDGSPEVIENRENKVQIRIDGDSGEYVILTMTVSGSILRVELDYYEDGVLDDEIQFVLNRTSDNLNELTLCAS
jgi:hypothetical protein